MVHKLSTVESTALMVAASRTPRGRLEPDPGIPGCCCGGSEEEKDSIVCGEVVHDGVRGENGMTREGAPRRVGAKVVVE